MNELKTIDNEHIEFLMNQWCSSSVVDSFVIYFFFLHAKLWVPFVNFIFYKCEKICIHLCSSISKCIKIHFVQKNQQSVFKWINFQSYWKNFFWFMLKYLWILKNKKKMMKHYLIKCFETWFDKIDYCIDENYTTKNTTVKAIWWTEQSTPWNKLYIWEILF